MLIGKLNSLVDSNSILGPRVQSTGRPDPVINAGCALFRIDDPPPAGPVGPVTPVLPVGPVGPVTPVLPVGPV